MSEAVANSKLAQIIETVKGLTVIELADLVHALEKEFGVSAAAVAAPGVTTDELRAKTTAHFEG